MNKELKQRVASLEEQLKILKETIATQQVKKEEEEKEPIKHISIKRRII
jgi:hypothetical protein